MNNIETVIKNSDGVIQTPFDAIVFGNVIDD